MRGSALRIGFALIGSVLSVAIPSSARAMDTEPPVVTVAYPNGGQVLTGAELTTILYSAVDNVGATNAAIYYRVGETEPWLPLDLQETPNGVFAFYVPNMPTAEARVRVVARDAAGNIGEDMSDGVFTILQTPGGFVGTTLRDFHLPGSQPLFGMQFQQVSFCEICHEGYDSAVEPGFNFNGSMMAHSARDPIFFAALAVANQDAPASGDYCLRCHSPIGWIAGRCNPTDATLIGGVDRDGVSCDVCHRMVDPDYVEGVSPIEDVLVLQALAPEDVPTSYTDGQYVLDPAFTWRGPFDDPEAQHPFLVSDFHRRSDMCGTCHDVSNPVYERMGGHYALAPLDQKADSVDVGILMPQERTFSEWKFSAFNSPTGVYAPEFAGSKPDGMVSTCQDCHMRDVVGRGCNFKFAPERDDLPLHDFSGANTWMLGLIDDLYPLETDSEAIDAGVERSRYMLRNAALLDVEVAAEADSFAATVTVTNRSGHKLPTGFAEGRRMWIHLRALDNLGSVVYESGVYDFETGELIHDSDAKIYEVEFGISNTLASLTGLPAAKSFHNVLNDTLYSDNRIPPLGFTNADYDAFGGKPVDPNHAGPGERYPDGQNWDVTVYGLPAETFQVQTTLYFQIITKEYVEFLRDQNTTNSAGLDLFNLWADNGRAAPEIMRADTSYTVPSDVPEIPAAAATEVRLGPNPFAQQVSVMLDLPRAIEVSLEVFDLQGRRIRDMVVGRVSAGAHAIAWDGLTQSGHDAGSGVFWIRVRTGDATHIRRAVRIR